MSALALRLKQINGARIENKSDKYVTRIRVTFENGYALSVIQSKSDAGFSSAYGDRTGETVEIALFDGNEEFTRILWPDEHDDVLGWQTISEAITFAVKASELPPFPEEITSSVSKELN